MTNEEDVEKKKGSMIFSLVSYVSINCIRFTGMISAQSTPTNNGVQSIYFAEEGQGVEIENQSKMLPIYVYFYCRDKNDTFFDRTFLSFPFRYSFKEKYFPCNN